MKEDMAFLQQSSHNRSRMDSGLRSKRMGGFMETSREEMPSNARSIVQREAENARLGIPANAQPRPQQSRLPQSSSSRKPSGSASGHRPPLTHETQSWSSTGSSSGRSINNAPPAVERDTRLGQPRNVLRRKNTTIAKDVTSIRNQVRSNSGRTDSSSSIPKSQASFEVGASPFDRTLTASPVEMQKPEAGRARVYPELDRYRDVPPPHMSFEDQGIDVPYRLATHDLPPPTPLFSGASSHSQLSSFSASPSTRFSESPGPGPYSRDTTPTSISSQSPGLIIPMRHPASKMRQPSPADTRPPVTRRRAGSISHDNETCIADPNGLAAVREALTSSSSNSTMRTEAKRERSRRRGISPPPRKSSAKNESPCKPPQKREDNYATNASPQARPTPPSRPSRDGAPDLYSQFGGSAPVIHSNLSSTSVADRRQSGQLAPSSLPRSTTSSTTSLDHPKPTAATREPTPAPRPSASSETQRSKTDNAKGARTPSPNVSTFRSRFPIFGRRHKNTFTEGDKKEKTLRKGPAAGTGHEGYGRVGGAVKRRSGSSSNLSRGLPGPVSSSESLASNQSSDSFLLDRMNPVIIAGGEIVENRNASSDLSRTESNQSIAVGRPSIDSRNNSSTSLSSREDTRQTLWPSAIPRNQSRRPSDSSDSEAVQMKPTIAFRRSMQRMRSADGAPVNIPKPILTRGVTSPPMGSIETTILTDDSYPDSRPEPIWDNKGGPKKLTKQAKSPRKWNLFGRTQNKSTTSLEPKQTEAPVPAAAQPAQPRQTAYYTMMDSSEQEDNDEQDEHDVVMQAAFLMPESAIEPRRHRPSDASSTRPSLNSRDRRPSTSGQTRGRSPSKAELPRAVPKQRRPSAGSRSRVNDSRVPPSSLTRPDVPPRAASQDKTRPSRLPQVGRIPKVVNSRPEHTPPQSFSRPFNRTSLRLSQSGPPPVDSSSVAKGPSPIPGPSPSPPKPSVPQFGSPKDELSASAPRKGSQGSTSSSSGYASFVNHTAIQPPPSAPLQEDEVWDEYNDLIGEAPSSPTSSHGVPFPLETYEKKLIKRTTAAKPLESPTINCTQATIRPRTSVAATGSSHYSADMTARINAAFRFGRDTPSTAFSFNDDVPCDAEDDNERGEAPQLPETKPPVASTRSSSCSAVSRTSRARTDSHSSKSSEDTPLSQVNLRVGSMTVSKWLTFGHVLFSPVRDDLMNVVGSLKRHSILVIDGLGNDDWSFYAAETYPAATFFNLSPRAPISQDHRSSTSFPLSPPNHHQIQFNAHTEKFPFGPESFTAVVFRFPTAAPESHYRNIISEARRVLKPGGYIELSILDADLHNVGNRTRRAVRRLKERITTGKPDYNLNSSADILVRQLGQKGFVDLKTCRVGVPVASAISTASSKPHGKKDERSLAEMMSDDTELGDENITNMVSKVGRWWYNRCYEIPAGMPRSIWNDKSLLSECHEWGTSLKLTVCHARIPEGRGRVASF